MDQDENLEAARQKKYLAQNRFQREPSAETKKAYKAASAAFNLALHHAGIGGAQVSVSSPDDEADAGQNKSSSADAEMSHISEEDRQAIDAARLAQNAAYREMYADPNPLTKQMWNQAKAEYVRVRRKLDPAFAAKLSESSRKSEAKRKKGKA